MMPTVKARRDDRRDAAEGSRISSALKSASVSAGTALWVGIACAALVLVFTGLSPSHSFFSVDVFRNVVLTASTIALLTVAQAMLLGSAQLDISQGAISIISSVAAGKVIIAIAGDSTFGGTTGRTGLAIVAGLLFALVVGGAIGLVNGLLVGWLGLNSLVVTLAMLGIATGAAEVLTKGANLSGLPLDLQTGFGVRLVAGVPVPTVIVVVIIVVAWLVFYRTKFGLHTLAIGSNRSAAERGAIRAGRHIVTLFVFSGVMSAVAGCITLARFATTDIGGHQSDALAALAGAVIGGTRLTGGRTSITGAVLGALLAVILQIGLVVINVDPFYQTIAIGIVLLIAITIDRFRSGRSDVI